LITTTFSIVLLQIEVVSGPSGIHTAGTRLAGTFHFYIHKYSNQVPPSGIDAKIAVKNQLEMGWTNYNPLCHLKVFSLVETLITGCRL
jgi:hypothetical protein